MADLQVGLVAPVSAALSFLVKMMTDKIAKQSETFFLNPLMLTKKYRKASFSNIFFYTSKRIPTFTSYTFIWNSCKVYMSCSSIASISCSSILRKGNLPGAITE